MHEKAPGSGGPAAGNPKGVKSGAQLLEEVKAQVQSGGSAREDVAPAVATIRATNPDGSANPDKETTAKTQEEAEVNMAKAVEAVDKESEKDAKVTKAAEDKAAKEAAEASAKAALYAAQYTYRDKQL